MATLNDLLKELMLLDKDSGDNDGAQHNTTLDDNDHKLKTPIDVYNRLCTDFPTLTSRQLQLLIDDLKSTLDTLDNAQQQQARTQQQTSSSSTSLAQQYKFTNILVSTLSEYSLKYNSMLKNNNINNNDTSQSQTQTPTQQQESTLLANCYSTLFYMFFVRLLRFILRTKDSKVIIEFLNDYYIEHESDDDVDDVHEEEDNKDDDDKIRVIKDDDEEDGEENYLDFNVGSHDFHKEYHQHETREQQDDWTLICNKLLNIYRLASLSYDNVSQDTVWEDHSIMEDIKDIVQSLFDTDSEHLMPMVSLIPLFIYLLRDRVLAKPSELPYVLPQLIDILHTSSSSSSNEPQLQQLSPFQSKTLLTVLDNMVSIPHKLMPKRSSTQLTQTIVDNLAHIVSRLAGWSSIPINQLSNIRSSSAKDELECLSRISLYVPMQRYNDWDNIFQSKTLFSQYLTLSIKLLNNPMDDGEIANVEPLRWLTSACCQSIRLTKFIQLVPEFIGLLESKESLFHSTLNHYYVVWRYLFERYPVNVNAQVQAQAHDNDNVNVNAVQMLCQKIDMFTKSISYANKDTKPLQQALQILQLLSITWSSQGVVQQQQQQQNNFDKPIETSMRSMEKRVINEIMKLQAASNIRAQIAAIPLPSVIEPLADTSIQRQEQRLDDLLKAELVQLRTSLKTLLEIQSGDSSKRS
ncbi:hypothetical protein SAMD00019534_010090 [Acytostelium subglobosum LB1]|uniref:hypothetical protein n=1 Tax=Acytostelium subglobosum LB1 TaxID=1410327 RepID=UPI000644941F|nr:hypothetical protein SAMD00019534_010090 [Acytostelium subglobosum LB1]GAM17834.1 hypothetical protein SAMD00019534_010090 [Acytostelium subglobosum LB1]|eukprot:XP_012758430.1 hypothetical protein SAMD00019534_010090 [Acytostelium subglobosum LB1]